MLEGKTKIIKEVLKDCLSYLKNKDLNNTKGFFIGTLHSIIPMKNLAIDIVGPFDLNWDGEVGKTWFLVIIDLCSRRTQVTPMKDLSANEVSQIFITDWLKKHETPYSILTDQGRQFIGVHFKEVCRLYGIRHKTSTTFTP